MVLAPLSKLYEHKFKGLFLESHLYHLRISLIYLFVLIPISHCLNYLGAVLCFELTSVSPIIFKFLVRIVFLGPLHFRVNFKFHMTCQEKLILIGLCWSVDQLKSIAFLPGCLLTYKHEVSTHLFRSSLFFIHNADYCTNLAVFLLSLFIGIFMLYRCLLIFDVYIYIFIFTV